MLKNYTKYDNGNNWLITNGNFEVFVKDEKIIEVKEIRGSNVYNISFEDLPTRHQKAIKELI